MKRYLFFLWNLWPPFFGAGIGLREISKDFKFVQMRLKRRPWTRNLIGVQFGGSIMAMTDPIYMTMLMIHLGPQYLVLDKAASVRFRKPGRTALFADFVITDEEINAIKERLKIEPKMDWEKRVLVKDKSGEVVAEVDRVVYIKNKKAAMA